MITRRRTLAAASTALFAAGLAPAWAAGEITVAFAGSMGVVMDRGIGPAFTKATGTAFHGIGQAAMALAHLLAAKTQMADVFVSVSAGPIKIVEKAGLGSHATPVASTSMVLAYSPKSKLAPQFAAAKGDDWTKILATPGIRIGRTDPRADPQGQYVLYTLELAEKYYKLPGFAAKVAGEPLNPAQIFAEPSLLARLQDGEIDATIGYESEVISQRLPFIALPREINFSTPALAKTWYDQASLTLTVKGVTKTTHPSPLVFYATALNNAANPQAAAAFVKFLEGPDGARLFALYGYNPGMGPRI